MFNKIIVVGRLTRDPELRYTQSGVAVTRMTVAVDRPFKNAGGEKETDFIDTVVWRKLAEVVANNLSKGRLVLVEGRLQIRPWEKDGVKHRQAEIVADTVRFLDRPKNGGGDVEDDEAPVLDDDAPF